MDDLLHSHFRLVFRYDHTSLNFRSNTLDYGKQYATRKVGIFAAVDIMLLCVALVTGHIMFKLISNDILVDGL